MRLQQVEAGEHGLSQGAALVPCGLGGKQAVRNSKDVCRGELCCCRSLGRRPAIANRLHPQVLNMRQVQSIFEGKHSEYARRVQQACRTISLCALSLHVQQLSLAHRGWQQCSWRTSRTWLPYFCPSERVEEL